MIFASDGDGHVRPGPSTLAIHSYGGTRTPPPSLSEQYADGPGRPRFPKVRGGPAMSEAPDPEVVALASEIFALARRGETEALARYVDAGVPADLTNDRGDSLVMLAAYHGHADAVRALLARGADANRINDRGQTPLAGAVFKGETEVVEALVEAGADPRAGTPSAVDTARMFVRPDMLELFGTG